MKNTLALVWAWGLVLVAYVCYERSQFQLKHLTQLVPSQPSRQPFRSAQRQGDIRREPSRNWLPSSQIAD